jgi:hypothetical protein
MILILYRIICAYIVMIMIRNLFKSRELQEKIVYAFMLIPFVLRVLLIK